MSSYRFNTKQSSTKLKDNQLSQSQYKTSSKLSRFPESKLLVLTVRRIFHSKIRKIFDQIRTIQRPIYNYLNMIQKLYWRRKVEAFFEILSRSKKNKLSQVKSKTNRVNIKIFLIQMLDRLYRKKLKQVYTSFFNLQAQNNLMQIKIKQFALLLQKIHEKAKKGYAWRKLNSICQKRKIIRFRMVFFNQIFHKLYYKTIKGCFHSVLLHSSESIYGNLLQNSKAKRKLCYDMQNNRRQLLINQRQHIYNLKQIIQNEIHDKSIKQGQMKRDRALKKNQIEQKIIVKQKQRQNKQIEVFRVEKNAKKLKQIFEKRKKLVQRSIGAVEKVQSLYNDIKYQEQIQPPLRTSYMGKIDLNRQKFRSMLRQYDEIKSQIEDFQIYDNINKNNLICLFENVAIDNIKPSNQYQIASEQNMNLKQCINSLLKYKLLIDKGDQLLKQDTSQLQCMLERVFILTEQDQKKQIEQSLRNSFASLRESKIIKKKPSIKTISISNRSIK